MRRRPRRSSTKPRRSRGCCGCGLPAPVGGIQSGSGVTDDAVRFSALVRIWNVTGQPAISLPLARTDDGLPIGVQLVAAPDRDDVLISLAAQLEAAAGWPVVATTEDR